MAVASLPVGAEPIQRQAQRTGGEIGKSFVRQQQEAAVVDQERQAPPPLLFGPSDPLIAGPQPARGGAKDQHAQPVATAVEEGIEQLFTDSVDIAQTMVLGQQAASASFGFGSREQLNLNLTERD